MLHQSYSEFSSITIVCIRWSSLSPLYQLLKKIRFLLDVKYDLKPFNLLLASSDFSEFENYHVSSLQNVQNKAGFELAMLAKFTFSKKCIAQSTGIYDMILQRMLFGSRISSERTLMHQLQNFISLFRRFYTFSNDLFVKTKRFQKFFTPSPSTLTSFLPQFLKREVYFYFKLKTQEFD